MLVACAVPSGRYWQPSMGVCFASMCALAAGDGIGIGVFSIEGTWVARSRNLLTRQAMDNGADYILFVDDDMVFPPDSMHRLLEHQKDIVGVQYSHRGPPYGIVGTLEDDSQKSGLAKAKILGTGVLLISISVFTKISEPWFLWTETHSDDAYFIEKAIKAGVEVWCDLELSKEIGHVGNHMFTLNGFKPHAYGVENFGRLKRFPNVEQNSLDSR